MPQPECTVGETKWEIIESRCRKHQSHAIITLASRRGNEQRPHLQEGTAWEGAAALNVITLTDGWQTLPTTWQNLAPTGSATGRGDQIGFLLLSLSNSFLLLGCSYLNRLTGRTGKWQNILVKSQWKLENLTSWCIMLMVTLYKKGK